MPHLTATDFATLRAGGTLPRPALVHLDGCLSCRRDFGAPFVLPRARAPRPWMLGAAAALAGALLVATPLRGLASSFLEVFEPRSVAFVPITLDEMRSLSRMPDLSAYGTTQELVRANSTTVASPQAASQLARFNVRVPSAGISPNVGQPEFSVTSPSAQRFAFSAARARAAALAKHAPLSPMPAGLDGSTLQIELGSTVVTTYASTAKPTQAFAQREVTSTSANTGTVTHRHVAYFRGSAPPIVIAQMQVPKVYSTGVSVSTLERYLLQQPGFPPRLAAALRAIGDPATTLPIPIPVDKAFAVPVAVDGVRGIGIGDETGLGAGVIWQNHGILYAVFAPLAAHDVLAIADSLR